MVGLRPIAEFTHKVEAVLDDIRSGRMAVTRGAITILLRAKDHLGAALDEAVEGRTTEAPADLVEALVGLKEGRTAPAPEPVPERATPAACRRMRPIPRPRRRHPRPGRRCRPMGISPLSDRVSAPARSPPQRDRPPRVPRRAARTGRRAGHGPCRCRPSPGGAEPDRLPPGLDGRPAHARRAGAARGGLPLPGRARPGDDRGDRRAGRLARSRRRDPEGPRTLLASGRARPPQARVVGAPGAGRRRAARRPGGHGGRAGGAHRQPPGAGRAGRLGAVRRDDRGPGAARQAAPRRDPGTADGAGRGAVRPVPPRRPRPRREDGQADRLPHGGGGDAPGPHDRRAAGRPDDPPDPQRGRPRPGVPRGAAGRGEAADRPDHDRRPGTRGTAWRSASIDDGRGLDRAKVLRKGIALGLLPARHAAGGPARRQPDLRGRVLDQRPGGRALGPRGRAGRRSATRSAGFAAPSPCGASRARGRRS